MIKEIPLLIRRTNNTRELVCRDIFNTVETL
jgi:hypothetical protein